MTGLQIALLVAGILAFQVVTWVPILRWIRHKTDKLAAEMRSALASTGEVLRRGPEPGNYAGASARFGRVKGHGVIALTDSHLHFRKVMGGPVDIELSEITSVREGKWFLGSYNGHRRVILTLRDGTQVGFGLRDQETWCRLLTPSEGRPPL